MSSNPVVKAFAYLLVHTPDFVRYGSKPLREMGIDPALNGQIASHLRSFEEAVTYPPNQVFLGNLHPGDLAATPEPWWKHPVNEATAHGAYGDFVDQETFYGFLKAADLFDLASARYAAEHQTCRQTCAAGKLFEVILDLHRKLTRGGKHQGATAFGGRAALHV